MSSNIKYFFALIFFSLYAFASERIVTKSIEEFAKAVEKRAAEKPIEEILVVYDLDSTLLMMEQDLGSDQWYNWQADLIKSGRSKLAVATNFNELFQLQGMLFALGRMKSVEKSTPDVVKRLQQKKIKGIVLTSRGPNYRGDTEEELNAVGIEFLSSAFGPPAGFAGTFLPEGFSKPREISYMNGIIMGSGQDKGKLLRFLLKKTGVSFKTIFFLDDTLVNIENMESEFLKDTEVNTFHYIALDVREKAFKKNKRKAIREWNQLRPVLKSVYGYGF